MTHDYQEHLNSLALGLLAETTGRASRDKGAVFFKSRPHDIDVALAAPEATDLLRLSTAAPTLSDSGAEYSARRILQLAVGVHRIAEDLFHAGWTGSHDQLVDLPLLRFSGQSENRRFLVGLLASFLPPAPLGAVEPSPVPMPATPERLWHLADLAADVSELEHAGVLRLLGDEALFSASVFPEAAHSCAIGADVLRRLSPVLPSAMVRMLAVMPVPGTLLELHQLLGPIWYRMAARNRLVRVHGDPLEEIADNFAEARMFLVRLMQGPLAPLRVDLFHREARPGDAGPADLGRDESV